MINDATDMISPIILRARDPLCAKRNIIFKT